MAAVAVVVLVPDPWDAAAVRLRLEWLHPAVVDGALSLTLLSSRVARRVLHRRVMRSMRPKLAVLHLCLDDQRDWEGHVARTARLTGQPPLPTLAFVPALFALDACLLYQACCASLTGGDLCPWALGDACARCGSTTWGVTCTPPEVRRGRLVRRASDDVTAFCAGCYARRPFLEPRDDERTQNAPQNVS